MLSRARTPSEPRLSHLLLMVVIVWVGLVGGTMAAGIYLSDDSRVRSRREVRVELVAPFKIEPNLIEVSPGTDLSFVVENLDDTQHDLKISNDVGTGRLKQGESAALHVGVVRSSFLIWCSIKGHQEQGMEGQVQLLASR